MLMKSALTKLHPLMSLHRLKGRERGPPSSIATCVRNGSQEATICARTCGHTPTRDRTSARCAVKASPGKINISAVSTIETAISGAVVVALPVLGPLDGTGDLRLAESVRPPVEEEQMLKQSGLETTGGPSMGELPPYEPDRFAADASDGHAF